MKGFKLVNGDVSITDNQIDLVADAQLEVQTIQSVLQTNKGEDPFDANEGIDFHQILGKNITQDMAKTQIRNGINQVSPDYIIEDFSYIVDKESRQSRTEFTARKLDGTAVTMTNSYI